MDQKRVFRSTLKLTITKEQMFKGRKTKSDSISESETKFENSERITKKIKLRKFQHDTLNMNCKNLNGCQYGWCMSNGQRWNLLNIHHRFYYDIPS